MKCSWWENNNPTYNVHPAFRCSDCRLSSVRGKYGCPLMSEPQMLLNENRELYYLAATSRGFEEFKDKDTAIAAMRRDKANLVVDRLNRRKRQVRDALNKCKDTNLIEQIATLLKV